MESYVYLLRSYQKLEKELELKEISKELNSCLELIEKLLQLENCVVFHSALSHIKAEALKKRDTCVKKIKRELEFQSLTDDILTTPSITRKRKIKIGKDNKDMFEGLETTPRVNGLKDIIGYDEVKKILQTYFILPLKQPHLFSECESINSFLLFGPPGTGKTRLVHALAAEAQAKLYCISPSDIVSEFVGKSERMIKTVFTHLKESTTSTILFIDEFDGLCRRRSNEHEHDRRLKTEIMCQMNSFGNNKSAFLICATNCPWDLDSAFIRRFGKQIYVPLPDRNERFELLAYYTRNTPLAKGNDLWATILSQTEGYSASDIATLIKTALSIPITELIETRKWKLSDDGFYIPVTNEDENEYIVSSNINDLPQNAVKARDVAFNDLIRALSQIKKTVSDTEIEKFKKYLR